MRMPDERPFTLRQIDQARGDLYAIADDLEFIKTQLARLPTLRSWHAPGCLSCSRRRRSSLPGSRRCSDDDGRSGLVAIGRCALRAQSRSPGPEGTLSALPLGPAHNHIDLVAPALGADEPPAPINNGGLGPVALGHLGRIRLRLILAISAPHDEPDASFGRVAERHRRARRGFQC
jgi:hypothetical protein